MQPETPQQMPPNEVRKAPLARFDIGVTSFPAAHAFVQLPLVESALL